MSGIYIHIPFCKQACHYCDFHFSTSLKYKEKMLFAIQKELIQRSVDFKEDVIETIYFGGGTPSLLSQKEIDAFLAVIYSNFSVIEFPEITLEANPDDLHNAKILELSSSKINRLSIGVQSFFEDDLKMMNRAHNSNEAIVCLDLATKYFDNITVDLIYGIPSLTQKGWEQNMQIIFDLGINHISCYALTVEDKTALASFIDRKTYPPVDEELALNHFNSLVEQAQKNGFIHYEISNFGKPNYFSKHNTAYWKGKRYLGVGPSAHSYYDNKRYWNIANNAKYIKALESGNTSFEKEELSINDRFNETVMIGLRTIYGVDLVKLKAEFGVKYFDYLLAEAKPFIKENTLMVLDNCLKTTASGKFLADGIASELFYV
ncbi:radical SAM family heme chaperone HemW [Flavicella sp.]|uniref:radical SAM family heme chaperone HemW n=1 Tax=Flavicella sp. TaxID=2957742 RepID=UPI0030159D55